MKLFIGFLLLSLVLICCTEEYKLSVEVTGNGSYEVTPQKNNYDEGESVTITAIPDSGWLFNKWLGSMNTNYNPIYLQMEENLMEKMPLLMTIAVLGGIKKAKASPIVGQKLVTKF